MAKISILEIIGDSSLAGAPRHLLSILENLDLEKFEIHCICPPGPLAGEIRNMRRKIDLDVIEMPSRLNWRAIKRIRRSIKHTKPEIIHVHGTRAGSLGRLAAAGLSIPVIYTEHLWTHQFKLSNRVLNFFHYIGAWILDLFTILNIAVSKAVGNFMVDVNITRREKVIVIYNGIDPSKEEADIFKDDQEYKLLTVATLNKNKGIQYLIKAMPKILKEFPQTKLTIVGEGIYKPNLVKQIKKMKLSKNVKFTGFVMDVDKEMAKYDLYVQPSLSESFGLAIVQAMSIGLPVIATNAGGIPEVVLDGITGVLVPPASSRDLAVAIIEMLRNQDVAKAMGKIARKEVRIRFALKDMMRDLEKVYEAVHKNPNFAE